MQLTNTENEELLTKENLKFRGSVFPTVLNSSLEIQVKQWSFPLCSNNMLFCAKTSNCGRYADNFFQHFANIEHETFKTVFKRSFVQIFVAELELDWFSVIATTRLLHKGTFSVQRKSFWRSCVLVYDVSVYCKEDKCLLTSELKTRWQRIYFAKVLNPFSLLISSKFKRFASLKLESISLYPSPTLQHLH